MAIHLAYLSPTLEKEYRFPDATRRDILTLFQTYKDLRPKLDHYKFSDGTHKELLCIHGTIPVAYKGNMYNIPVCIWLFDSHPYNPPVVYVKPTDTMCIDPGQHVDNNGKVSLPYMQDWRHPVSDLLGLTQVMEIVFSESPPVSALLAPQSSKKPPRSRNTSDNRSYPSKDKANSISSNRTTLSKEVDYTILLAKYSYPDAAKRDILGLFKAYKDLRPKLEYFVFNDGTRKELFCLEGTIPVDYKGNTYNIPLCLWLLDLHPHNPPMVYVKPTSTMQIKPGKHVDSNGKVYLPYLHDWTYPSSDLLGLAQILAIVFSETPPLFSRAGTR